jgi:ABC-type branched-subunit amino acid transport system substrate-binding protein
MIRRRTLLAACAATTASLAAPRTLRAADAPYVLGTLFPMAGPNAEYGRIFTQGAEMALTHISEDRMLQRPIALKVEDSQATPQGGALGMTKLVNVDHAIWVLIGFTGVSKAAAPISGRAQVITVNGGGVGPDLSGLTPYFWNVIPLANQELRALTPWMAKQGYKRIAMIYVDDPAGNALLQELKAGLAKNGGELVGTYSIQPTAQQFGAIAAKARDAKPDAIYFASYGAQQSQIIKQLRDNGLKQPLLTYSAASIASVIKLPDAEGLVYTTQVSDWNATDPVTRRFVTDWRAKYHIDPTTYNQNYYNATRLFGLLAQGLEKQGKEVNGDTMRAELLRVRRFPLVGGEGTFDDKGDMSMAIQINQIKGGKVERIA